MKKQYGMGGGLNYSMKNRYADGGDLTRFDEGGTHEQNPLGGIPQGQSQDGQMNTVEQGETKMGNFIYSDRISLNPDMIKKFNLPGYAAGKSVADASKAIEDKFKDRNDKYANETKTTLLKRLEQAQETHKAEQAQMQGAMDANAQQGPEDMMGGQIPEGMEEFAGEQPQMAPEEAEATPMAAYGGYQPKMYFEGGELDPVTGLAASGAAATAGPSASSIVGGLSTAMELGQTAFGKATQDISGTEASGRVGGAGMVGGSAIKGAAAGAAIGGPWGAAIFGTVGGIAGIAGLGKARKAEALNTQRFATNTNKKFSDNYAAYGGNLNIRKYANGGDIDPRKDPRLTAATRQDSINVRDRSIRLMDDYRKQGYTEQAASGVNFPANSNKTSYNQMEKRFNDGSETQVIRGGDRNKEVVDPANYRRNEGPYNYTQREAANGVLNFDMSPGYYDSRIAPTGFTNLMGTKGGSRNDGVSFANYANMKISPEPVAVKAPEAVNRQIQSPTISRTTTPLKTAQPIVQNKAVMAPRRNSYAEVAGPIVRDNTRIGTSFSGYDPALVRKANTKFALGGSLDPEAESLASIKISQDKLNESREAGILKQGSENAAAFTKYADARALPPTLSERALALGKKGVGVVNENAAEAMRYTPIMANMLQRKNLKAPTGVQYATLENRFKPTYADEAQLQVAASQASNNAMNSISQSGASEGAQRNFKLGVNANEIKGLSDATIQFNAQKASQDATAQQFNLGVDSSNVATRNRAIDEMRMDDAAYRGAKSKLLGQMGTDLGSIGKEQADAQLAGALTGYTRKGKYLYKPDGTKATPAEVAKVTNIYNRNQGATPTLKKGDSYIDENGKTQQLKMGGYLTTKKYK